MNPMTVISNSTHSSDNKNDSLSALGDYHLYYYYVEDPVHKDTVRMFDVVVGIGLTGIVSMFGLITNIINIIVFYRQGLLSDSSTASLTGLAVSDFLCCLITFLASLVSLLQRMTDDIYYALYLQTIVSCISTPKYLFTQITCWVTAYLAFERFFSVMFPFKVKIIFTPLKSYAFICSVYVMTFALYAPRLFTYLPSWVHIPSHNVTVLMLIRNTFMSTDVKNIVIVVNMLFFRVGSIMIVIVCNVMLLWKVNLSKKFRKRATATTQPDLNTTVSRRGENDNAITGKDNKKSEKKDNKDMKLLRMVMTICVMFVTCYSLDILYQIQDILFRSQVFSLNIDDSLSFGQLVLIDVSRHFFETVNSSCNVFIYYTMSSKFKKELQLLCVCNKKK